MAYWKEWKSLIGGGIGFVILGIIMIVFYTMPGTSGARGMGGMNMMQIGIVFLIIGIVMMVTGWMLRGKREEVK